MWNRIAKIVGVLFIVIAVRAVTDETAQGQQPTAKSDGDALVKDYADQLPRIPAPSLKESLQSFHVTEGFEVELVASEPQVSDPVAIAFDEQGRMFVAEMRGYSEDGEKNLGVVRRLEDRDNDGVFETATVYLDGLSWPTAIICWRGGVLVGAAPHIYYCRDTDDDGRADEKEIVFTGFHRTNVQGLLNSLRWGIDNRIHGATSSSGANVTALRHEKTPALSLRRRDFIIEPRDMTITAASGGGQHGQSFDRFGRRYVCSNSNHLQLMMFEDRYLARNPHLKAPAANVNIAADGTQAPVFRTSPVEPWRIVRTRLRAQGLVPGPLEGGGRPAGYFTGATGATIYEGHAFGKEFRGNAFIADCGSNLIHRKIIEPRGVGAIAQRAEEKREFLSSSDIWFRPVQMANAPDGTLYVLDMSREVIEHPKSLPPPIKKHLDLTSGRNQGRIYRIVPKGFRQGPPIRLADLSGNELVKTLEHPNGWHRDTAARLIYERQDQSLVPALEKLASQSKSPVGRIRSMYALAGMDTLTDDALLARLVDTDPRVREHAVRLSESLAEGSPRLRAQLIQLADDSDLRVRYQLAFSLGEIRSPARVPALVRVVTKNLDDPWIRLAVMSSLAADAATTFDLLASDEKVTSDTSGQSLLVAIASQVAAQSRPDETASLLRSLGTMLKEHRPLVGRIAQAMVVASPDGDTLRRQLAEITSGDSSQLFGDLTATAIKEALNEKLPVAQRCAAVRTLRIADFSEVENTITTLIDPSQPSELRVAVMATLREFDSPAATKLVIRKFPSLSPATRGEALEMLLSRQASAEKLLDEIAAGRFARSNVPAGHRRMLLNHRDEQLRSRAKEVFNDEQLSSRADVIKHYQEALELNGDRARGRAVFRKTCAACHRLEDHGHELGKDLKSIGNSGAAAILTNVLDPNREIDPAYLNYTLVTERGRVYTGVIVAENATSLTLKRAGGATDTVLRNEIDELTTTGQSIMPVGLEKEVGQQEMADLITYLLSQ